MAESEVALYTVVHCAIYGTTSLENSNTCTADTGFQSSDKSDLRFEVWKSVVSKGYGSLQGADDKLGQTLWKPF